MLQTSRIKAGVASQAGVLTPQRHLVSQQALITLTACIAAQGRQGSISMISSYPHAAIPCMTHYHCNHFLHMLVQALDTYTFYNPPRSFLASPSMGLHRVRN